MQASTLRNLVGLYAAFSLLNSTSSLAFEVYSNDFDGNEVVASGVNAEFIGHGETVSVEDFAGIGLGGNQFGGQMWHNDSVKTNGDAAAATRLVLTNLPTHQYVNLNFLLALLDSWDGNENGRSYDPDRFNVVVGSDDNGQVSATISFGSQSTSAFFDGDNIDGRVYHHNNLSTSSNSDSVTLSAVEHHANVSTNDGNDNVAVNTVEHHSNVSTGNGDDTVTVGRVEHHSAVSTGDGNDNADLGVLEHHGSFSTGSGSDGVIVDRVEHHSSLSTGSEDDILFIDRVEHNASVSVGSGDDFVRFTGSQNQLATTISGGSGNDSIDLTDITRAEYDSNSTLRNRLSSFENIRFSDGSVIGDAAVFNIERTVDTTPSSFVHEYEVFLTSEPNAEITVDNLPAGTRISGMSANVDGSYTVLADGDGNATVTLVSDDELTSDQLSAMTGHSLSMGEMVFSETFSNFSLNNQSATPGPTTTLLSFGGPSRAGTSHWSDSSYALALEAIAHSGSTLIVDLYASGLGWQGGHDESWAIDNLSIELYGGSATAVPIAPSWFLLLPALIMLGRRRRIAL